MNNEIICGIYGIKNCLNGKMYVGQAINIYKRWKDHIDDLDENKHYNVHLQRSWNLYGKQNFQFLILEECSAEKLNEKEMFYVDKFDAYYNGYNQTRGGDGSLGYKHSEEVIEKMSQIQQERFQDIRNREVLCDAHKFESKPIYQIDFNGNIIKEWPSANWASKMLNLNVVAICNALKRRQRKKTYNGYIWIYVEEYDTDTFDLNWYIDRQWKYKPYYQYDTNYNLIKKWDSVIDAEAAGFKREAIYRCSNLHIPTYKGFIFRDYLIEKQEEGVEGDGRSERRKEIAV